MIWAHIPHPIRIIPHIIPQILCKNVKIVVLSSKSTVPAGDLDLDKQSYVLKQIYFSRIRCKLEQSAAVWNSSLTLKNIDDLERVQKAAVRIINGRPYESYTETLKNLGIMRLSARRDIICLKFAKNSMKLNNFKHLFPKHSNMHEMVTRQQEKYHVVKSNSIEYATTS